MKKKLHFFVYLTYFLLCFYVFNNCSTISKTYTIESNKVKNQASDNTKTANEFMQRYDYLKALAYFEDALRYNTMVDNTAGMILNNTDIGKVYLLLKKYDSSLTYIQKALNLAGNEKGFLREKAYALNGMGEAYYFSKNFNQAKKYYKKALKIESSLNNVENQAIIMLNLAKIDRNKGNYDAALKKLITSSRLFEILYFRRNIENPRNLSLVYYSIGQTYSKLENLEKATEFIEKALELDKLIENASGIADDYYALGILEEKKERSIEQVLKYYFRSRDIYHILDNVEQYIQLTEKITELYSKTDDLKAYFISLKLLYTIKKGEKDISDKIIQLMQHENIEQYFTQDEVKTILKKYK